MILYWTIRYLDTASRQFGDRRLFLDTNTLGSIDRARVELCHKLSQDWGAQIMVQFRGLFTERDLSGAHVHSLAASQAIVGMTVPEYFEDETGRRLSTTQIGEILFGRPVVDARLPFKPPSTEPRVLEVGPGDIAPEDLRVLEYFTRDLREMQSCAFMSEGPGQLGWAEGGRATIQTAVTHAEIVEFVTVFRRLHMPSEPGGLRTAVEVFSRVAERHWTAHWVATMKSRMESALAEPPVVLPFTNRLNPTFSRRLLLEVFIYTRFAHQPNRRRAKQYENCLVEAGGDRELLTWLFLSVLFECAIEMRNVGREIVLFFTHHTARHATPLEGISPLDSEHSGIGMLEGKHVRYCRLLASTAHQLSLAMCREAGRDPAEADDFLGEAEQMLQACIPAGLIDRDGVPRRSRVPRL